MEFKPWIFYFTFGFFPNKNFKGSNLFKNISLFLKLYLLYSLQHFNTWRVIMKCQNSKRNFFKYLKLIHYPTFLGWPSSKNLLKKFQIDWNKKNLFEIVQKTYFMVWKVWNFEVLNEIPASNQENYVFLFLVFHGIIFF